MNQQNYDKYGDILIYDAQQVVLLVSEELVKLHKVIIKDPKNIIKYRKIYERNIKIIASNFDKKWKLWANNDLAEDYFKGIHDAENTIKAAGKSVAITSKISDGRLLLKKFPPPPGIPELSGQISMLFSGKYADHKTFFGVFRQAAYYSLDGQQFQILRASNDIFKKVSIMSGENFYSEADIFTRRKFSQAMLDDFAKRGLQTITYKNGARYSIDSYCETVGRTVTARCGLQANLNRLMQNDYNLVIVSSHFRACQMCIPYEGVTLSIDGKSNKYESIDDAIRNGLFHCNCVHDVSAFFECITPEELPRVNPYEQKLIDEHGYNKAQQIAYEAQQRQRAIERQIRTWKRRKSVSLNDNRKDYSQAKINFWQKEQREHLEKNKFLHRKYTREQIKKAH